MLTTWACQPQLITVLSVFTLKNAEGFVRRVEVRSTDAVDNLATKCESRNKQSTRPNHNRNAKNSDILDTPISNRPKRPMVNGNKENGFAQFMNKLKSIPVEQRLEFVNESISDSPPDKIHESQPSCPDINGNMPPHV